MINLVPLLSYRTKTKNISNVIWSPDGEYLALVSRTDRSLDLVQSRTGQEVYHGVQEISIHTAAWSPDSRLLALGGKDASSHKVSDAGIGGMLLFDVHRQQVVQTFTSIEAVSALAWSAHNPFMSRAAREVTVWEREQWKKISTIQAKDSCAANYAGWLQDGQHLLVAWTTQGQEIERTFTIYEATTGKHIDSIEVDKSPRTDDASLRDAMAIRSLALAPTGTALAVAGVWSAVENDPEAPLLGIISLIDLATGQERRLAAGIFGRSLRGPFTESICWSYDGRLLTTSGWLSRQAAFLIFDAATGNAVDFTVAGQRSGPTMAQNVPAIRALAWSPGDNRLAVATSEICDIYQAVEDLSV
ncbi:MAG TPA: hypothetical protein VFN35_22925 [Ktedonobacteraceae bacterium]|nr:hypothetical protein [Ktedonobacteraceae bacterium]